MKDKKQKPLTVSEMRKTVKTKVRKEYEGFLSGYRKFEDEKRFRKMVEDAEMIGFYRNLYIIIVIIGDFTVEEWKWLYLYYKGIDIIKDSYRSYVAFRKDSKEEKNGHDELSFLASMGLNGAGMGAVA